jgi:hypothetical protein
MFGVMSFRYPAGQGMILAFTFTTGMAIVTVIAQIG